MVNPDPINPINPITPVKDRRLEEMIDLLQSHHVDPGLIIALIMTNPDGTGAMDNVSKKVKGVTDATDVLSNVQTDLIDIGRYLSNIEKELGTGKSAPGQNQTLTPDEMTNLKHLQTAYKKLFGNDGSGNESGDLHDLEKFTEQFPEVGGVVEVLKNLQGEFTANYNSPVGKDRDPPAFTFNLGEGIVNFDPNQPDGSPRQKLVIGVLAAAELFWNANNSTPHSPTPMGTTDATTDISSDTN